jgi:hypothetical protein
MRPTAIALLFVAACGDQLAGPGMIQPPDALAPSVVRIRLLVDEPDSPGGWPVYFQNADGSLVSAQRTGTDGSANAFMGAGGYVTLVYGQPQSSRIFTYTAVSPGDELELDLRSFTLDTVIVPMQIPPAPNGVSYQLNTSCGPANLNGAHLAPAAVMLPRCAEELDMLVIARGGDGRIANTLYAEAVSIEPPSLITLTGEYLLPTESTVTVINIPDSVTSMAATHGSLGRRDLIYTQRLQMDLSTTSSSVTFHLPQKRTGTILDPIEDFAAPALHVADWRDAHDHGVIDLARRLPRRTEEPRYDPLARSIVWAEQPGTVEPDSVIAAVQFFGPQSFVEWQVIAPRTAAAAVRLPVLPDRTYEPIGETQVHLMIDIAAEGGYDKVRELALGRLPDRAWPMTGPSGHVIYQVARPGLE